MDAPLGPRLPATDAWCIETADLAVIFEEATQIAVPPFAVALLKGGLWQGNADRGIIHRSPAVATGEAPRVLVAIDAIWD